MKLAPGGEHGAILLFGNLQYFTFNNQQYLFNQSEFFPLLRGVTSFRVQQHTDMIDD